MAGYEVSTQPPHAFKAGDVFVTWNRYGYNHKVANAVEAVGGIVLVAENGYLGRDENEHQLYAIAKHGHNGSGAWHVGDGARWAAMGIELRPWRTEGKHILVCGQRGIGSPTMASPPNWHDDVAARLRKITNRPVRVRPHPGNHAPKVPLADDLRDCWAVVIWSSGSGVQALVAGVPVIYQAPHWICERSASNRLEDIEATPDENRDILRLWSMEYLAWAQWSVQEISTGEPFWKLLA